MQIRDFEKMFPDPAKLNKKETEFYLKKANNQGFNFRRTKYGFMCRLDFSDTRMAYLLSDEKQEECAIYFGIRDANPPCYHLDFVSRTSDKKVDFRTLSNENIYLVLK